MPRRAATVTQADVARAIRAAKQEGLTVTRIVVRPDGAFVETADAPEPPTPPLEEQAVVVL